MSNALQEIVLSTRDTFASRLSDKSISFEAESGFAMQALATDYAMKTALGNKQSVIDAVTNIAAIGISLNPAKKQAYLVPRDGKICLDISYMGLIDLAVATGAIKWAQAAIVYTSDNFQLRGFDEAPLHTFSPFDKNRGEIIGVYCVVKTADGEYLTHSMPISEVYAIRDRSQSYKSGKASPWKSDEGEMIKKTCIKQAYKYWPKVNERLQSAIQYLNTDGGEGLPQLTNQPTRNPNGKQEQVRDIEKIEGLVATLEAAAKGGTESFKTTWKALAENDKALVGIPERDRIKAIADTHNKPAAVIEGEYTKESEAVNG
ncbi:MAG: DNA recombinase [Methylotenera sp.]|nr:MAG: DNA recombinase [Methylotenera sp.]